MLHYILISQNSLADRLAKWSAGQQDMFEGDHMPEC